MSIGSKIKEIRLSKGLTQKQLGERCGMADSAIRRYESDRGNPTEKTLSRIADALGVFVIDLLPENEIDKVSPDRMLAELIMMYHEGDGQNDPAKRAAFEDFIKDTGMRVDVGFDESTGKNVYEVYMFDNDTRLLNAYSNLNYEGKCEAVKRVEELAQLEQYRKESDTDKEEKPPQGHTQPHDGK